MASDLGDCSENNVEIKAHLHTEENYQNAINIAESLCGNKGYCMKQKDIFFGCGLSQTNRLKLRYLNKDETPSVMDENKAVLILYNRNDQKDAKLSNYILHGTDSAKSLHKILEEVVGVRGQVLKERRVFIYGQTRIHLDCVEGLGYFLEFEVCMRKGQEISDGERVAEELLEVFQIKNSDLIEHAYFDMLQKK